MIIIEGRTIITVLLIISLFVSYFVGKDMGKEKIEIEQREERIKALEKLIKENKELEKGE